MVLGSAVVLVVAAAVLFTLFVRKQDLPALLTGGSALGIKHAGHISCGNKVPLGNLIRTVTEKMGVTVDDRFYGGAHTGVIKELS